MPLAKHYIPTTSQRLHRVRHRTCGAAACLKQMQTELTSLDLDEALRPQQLLILARLYEITEALEVVNRGLKNLEVATKKQ